MKYALRFLEAYLRAHYLGSCWRRELWRFDTTEQFMVVGVPSRGNESGSALVYRQDHGKWNQQRKLTPVDERWGDGFGYQVALHGNVIAVSAPTANAKRGAVHLYRWDGLSWEAEQRIAPPAEDATVLFGSSIDLGDDILVVGADGASRRGVVYAYRRVRSTWALEQRLSPETAIPGAEYGYALSILGNELIVGAPSARGCGVVYAYENHDRSWIEQQVLSPTNAFRYADFGRHVAHALDERGLVVGSLCFRGGETQSTAHVFAREHGSWSFFATLDP